MVSIVETVLKLETDWGCLAHLAILIFLSRVPSPYPNQPVLIGHLLDFVSMPDWPVPVSVKNC